VAVGKRAGAAVSEPQPIWRWHDKRRVLDVVRHEEIVIDETPGFEGITVRTWMSDSGVDLDFVSHRYTRNEDGQWVRT
jgi:hypothetical protein